MEIEPEILPSAIEAICAKFKKAADIYCQKYPRHGVPVPGFEAAVSSYERHKREFNKTVQVAMENGDGTLPEWARDAVIYQMERGFLDRLWLTWDEGAAIPWKRAQQTLQEV